MGKRIDKPDAAIRRAARESMVADAAVLASRVQFIEEDSHTRLVIIAEFPRNTDASSFEEILDKIRETGYVVTAQCYRHAPITEDLV